jgi:ATP-dependent Clp protease ATP-binding subunit ClpA
VRVAYEPFDRRRLKHVIASNNYKQRTSEVIDDLRRLKRNGDEIIIFIDDLELAARDDGMNLWVDLLNEGLIRCFGTSSRTGFTKYVQNNTLLQRQIVRIDIEEPSAASTLSILRGTRERYEKHHDVQIPDAALEAVVKLAKQYIRDRLLPDKAIDLRVSRFLLNWTVV